MGLELSRGGSAQHYLDTSAVAQRPVAQLSRAHVLRTIFLAVESADLCFSHCGTENWILSCAFRNSTPPSVAHNIDHQRKSPINPSSACILRRKMLYLLPDGGSHEDTIPRGTEKQSDIHFGHYAAARFMP